jgi:ribosomal protein L37E
MHMVPWTKAPATATTLTVQNTASCILSHEVQSCLQCSHSAHHAHAGKCKCGTLPRSQMLRQQQLQLVTALWCWLGMHELHDSCRQLLRFVQTTFHSHQPFTCIRCGCPMAVCNSEKSPWLGKKIRSCCTQVISHDAFWKKINHSSMRKLRKLSERNKRHRIV